jgi:hypothetical protein
VLATHPLGAIAIVVADVEAFRMLAGHVAGTVAIITTLHRTHPPATVGVLPATVEGGVTVFVAVANRPGPTLAISGMKAAVAGRQWGVVVAAGDRRNDERDTEQQGARRNA